MPVPTVTSPSPIGRSTRGINDNRVALSFRGRCLPEESAFRFARPERYCVIRPAHPPPGANVIFNLVPRLTCVFVIL